MLIPLSVRSIFVLTGPIQLEVLFENKLKICNPEVRYCIDELLVRGASNP